MSNLCTFLKAGGIPSTRLRYGDVTILSSPAPDCRIYGNSIFESISIELRQLFIILFIYRNKSVRFKLHVLRRPWYDYFLFLKLPNEWINDF